MIIVTGGAGFIGSHVVDRLIADGHDVTIVDNLSTGLKDNINPRADFIYSDVECLDTVPPHDVVFHLAALARIQPSFGDPLTTYRSNALGTAAVLEWARRHKSRVVYAGSSSAYSDVYANPYTYTKWAGEQQCELYWKVYGLPTNVARFFNVYGPRHIEEGGYATVIGVFERQMREGRPLTVTGDGEQRRDFTHVLDIVDGLVALSQGSHPGEIFQFGTGVNYSINEVAAMFGGPVEYIPKRPGEAWETLADFSEAASKLGYSPSRRLPEYVAGTKAN